MYNYSKYLLYYSDKHAESEDSNEIAAYFEYWQPSLIRCKPEGAPKSLIIWWLYYLTKIILGKPSYGICIILEKNRIIHYTVAAHKCFKFPFMSEEDIQIGPSWTDPEYRNRGIASNVIDEIRKHYGNEAKKYYWIVGEENYVSRHVVEKLGFRNCGEIHKKRALGMFPIYKA